MTKKIIKLLIVFVVCAICFGVSSCGTDSKTTLYAKEAMTTSGCSSKSSKTKLEWVEERIKAAAETQQDSETYKNALLDLFANYVIEETVASNTKSSVENSYMVCELRLISKTYTDYVNANAVTYIYNEDDLTNAEALTVILNGTAGCLDIKNRQATDKTIKEILTGSEDNVLMIACAYMIQINDRVSVQESEPIQWKGGSFKTVMANFWNNFFIFPVGWLVNFVSTLLGGYYWLGLVIVTLLIRTLGWPIYSKSNDMSMKMSEMQPELTKIQEKYQGKNDPDSQRAMQMEQAQLYKKYKVGLGGCLAPLIQFPIFIAVYRAIMRIPYTIAIDGSLVGSNYSCTNNWANTLKSELLGVDLFQDKTGGAVNQLIGVIVLIVLVVGTQFVSNYLTKLRQKKTNEAKQSNIPAYRRQAYDQQQNNKQMNMMLYMMSFMMGAFVWSSKAGLGLYWLIGNLFAMGQTWINGMLQQKKIEKKLNKR